MRDERHAHDERKGKMMVAKVSLPDVDLSDWRVFEDWFSELRPIEEVNEWHRRVGRDDLLDWGEKPCPDHPEQKTRFMRDYESYCSKACFRQREARRAKAQEEADAFWAHNHEVLKGMDDHERGWYSGFVDALFRGHVGEFEVDPNDPIYTYDPKGDIQDSKGFYDDDPPKLPDTAVSVMFDPEKFLAMATELDREAALFYFAFEGKRTEYGSYLIVRVFCTEVDEGDPQYMEAVWERLPWRDIEGARKAWKIASRGRRSR